MERHRNDGIGMQVLERGFQMLRPQLTEQFRQPLAALVLEPQDYFPQQTVVWTQSQYAFKAKG
jgi:hypothetical protein